jgi:hypothetical protein
MKSTPAKFFPTHVGADFSCIFSAEIFRPKNFGENWNYLRKKFRKIVFPRNSAEKVSKNRFPKKFRGKSFEKSFSQEIPRKITFR